MASEALNRIIKEINALTPHERRELIDRLTHEEQGTQQQIVRRSEITDTTVKDTDFDDANRLSSKARDTEEAISASATLCEWLTEARNMRAELPLTSDSVDILRELREVRFRQ